MKGGGGPRCDKNDVYKTENFPCKEVTDKKNITGDQLQSEIKTKIISYINKPKTYPKSIIFLTKIKINYNKDYSIPPFFPFTYHNVVDTVKGIQEYLEYIARIQNYNSVEIKYYYERIYTDDENVMAIMNFLPEVAAELSKPPENSSYV